MLDIFCFAFVCVVDTVVSEDLFANTVFTGSDGATWNYVIDLARNVQVSLDSNNTERPLLYCNADDYLAYLDHKVNSALKDVRHQEGTAPILGMTAPSTYVEVESSEPEAADVIPPPPISSDEPTMTHGDFQPFLVKRGGRHYLQLPPHIKKKSWVKECNVRHSV